MPFKWLDDAVGYWRHFSKSQDLVRTDPGRFGSGLRGPDLDRVRRSGGPGRTYFYLDPDARPEQGTGPFEYVAEVDQSRIYDFDSDPDGLVRAARAASTTPDRPTEFGLVMGGVDKTAARNRAEQAVLDAGYRGFSYTDPDTGRIGVLFDEQDVRPAANYFPARATRETAPGATVKGHLPGISADPELKRAYDNRVRELLYPEGRDPFTSDLGMESERVGTGVGVYGGQSSPGHVSLVRGNPDDLNITESVYALLNTQDAYGFNRPSFGGSANSLSVDIGRPLSESEMGALASRLSELDPDAFPALTPTGVDLIHPGFDGDVKELRSIFSQAVEAAGLGDARQTPLSSSTGYMENDWSKSPMGQAYVDRIMQGTPEQIAAADSLVRRLARERNAIDMEFADAAGGVNDDVIKMREILAEQGVSGLASVSTPPTGGAVKVVDQVVGKPDPRFDPRVKEQERLLALETEVVPRGTQDVPNILLSDLEGMPFVTSMSDRTAAGGELVRINDTILARPVDLRGGQGFMHENPGLVWASAKSPVSNIMNRAAEMKAQTGIDPIFIPWRMAPTGGDFSTMTGEAMLAFASSAMGKGAKRSLNARIKKKIPDWAGVDDPASVEQWRNAPDAVRKELKNLMDTQFRGAGGLSIGEARLAVADPRQIDAMEGGIQEVGRIFADEDMVPSDHPSYPFGVPGEGLGRIVDEVGIYELLPEKAAERGIADPLNPSAQDMRAMQMGAQTGIINETILKRLADRGVNVGGLAAAAVVGGGLLVAPADEANAAALKGLFTPKQSLTDTLSGYSDEALRMLQKSALDEGKADEAARYGREIETRSAPQVNWTTDDLDAIGAIPNTYDMARDPDYFRKNKDIDFQMVDMSPDQYIEEAARNLGTDVESLIAQRSRDTESLDFLRDAMRSGKPIQPGFLDYKRGGQEGIHRAMVAKELGVDSIPVATIRSVKGGDRIPRLDPKAPVFDDEHINLIQKGLVGPKLLAPMAAGAATIGYATSEFAAAESSLSATESDFQASAERFKALRKGKRAQRLSRELERVLAPVAGPAKALMDATEVMLVGVAGGIPGYLSELTGYVRGQDLEEAKAGGEALAGKLTGTMAEALGEDWDPQNPYLQGLAKAMEQGEKEFQDAYRMLGVENSVMKKGWDQLPERAQRIITGLADLAL